MAVVRFIVLSIMAAYLITGCVVVINSTHNKIKSDPDTEVTHKGI